nr:peptidylprolyl isomerase [Streptomyces sp. HNM0574]
MRQEQRRAEARRKRRIRLAAGGAVLAVALVAAVAYAVTGGEGGSAGDGAADAKGGASSASGEGGGGGGKSGEDPCGKPADGKPGDEQWETQPAMKIDASASYTMSLGTNCGDITVAMDAEKAPRTVNSFNFLAGEGFFDHTRCHRLVDEGIHVLQCGDPTGTGQGGPGYTVPDENLKDAEVRDGVYPAGTVAMANQYDAASGRGRDSGGSQFFLVFEDSQLPPDYTPFGKITGGMDVLEKIAAAGSAPDPQTQNSAPNAHVVIDRATVRKT